MSGERERIRGIIDRKWAELEKDLFSPVIEGAVAGMIEEIQTEIDSEPDLLEIHHYQLAEIGSRELSFMAVMPGPISLPEIVHLHRETGRVFILSGFSCEEPADANPTVKVTLTPGNGCIPVLITRRPGRVPWDRLLRWIDRWIMKRGAKKR